MVIDSPTETHPTSGYTGSISTNIFFEDPEFGQKDTGLHSIGSEQKNLLQQIEDLKQQIERFKKRAPLRVEIPNSNSAGSNSVNLSEDLVRPQRKSYWKVKEYKESKKSDTPCKFGDKCRQYILYSTQFLHRF